MRFGICLATFCAALAICPGGQGATLKTLYSFCSQQDCADGYVPDGAMVRDQSGNLFGVTFYGGSAIGFQGNGTVFELSPGQGHKWALNTLHTFCTSRPCIDGEYPDGNLIIDTSGNLYGGTAFGGDPDQGVLYEVSPAGAQWNYTVLHTFAGPDGAVPAGGLSYVGANAGAPYDGVSALYGATQNFGGGNTGGTVYEMVPNSGSWTLTTLYGFSPNDQNGYGPTQNVTLDASGTNIYGVTDEPYGDVFQLTNAGGGVWNESTLYTFNPSKADLAYSPSGTLFLDSSGTLTGLTGSGGPHCKRTKHHGNKRCGGNVFTLSGGGPDPTYNVIYDFCIDNVLCDDGSVPTGNLVADASGNLYGTTISGGSNSRGTIFRIRRGKKIEVVYNFCSLPNCSDGSNPDGGLTIDAKGHLYGVTNIGGANNGGTAFEFSP